MHTHTHTHIHTHMHTHTYTHTCTHTRTNTIIIAAIVKSSHSHQLFVKSTIVLTNTCLCYSLLHVLLYELSICFFVNHMLSQVHVLDCWSVFVNCMLSQVHIFNCWSKFATRNSMAMERHCSHVRDAHDATNDQSKQDRSTLNQAKWPHGDIQALPTFIKSKPNSFYFQHLGGI